MNEPTELITAYKNGVEQLRAAIAGLSPAELQARPIDGKWSTHEVICHLADFEIINADRMKRIIAEVRPTLFNAEPDPFAEHLAYAQRETHCELELIAGIRTHIATILASLSAEQWQRIGIHSAAGPLTLLQMLQRTTKHIPHHLPFIAEKRAALGK